MKDRTVKQVQCMCGGVLVREGRVNGGHESEGVWLMGFIYVYETE
jgi:hypothetical protein